MKNDQTDKLAHLLSGNHRLNHLRDKITQLQAINQSLRAILPEEMREHCQVANLRNQKLIVACDSAVWSTRLRFIGSSLAQGMRQQGYPVAQVIGRVLRDIPSIPEHTQPTAPSEKVKQQLTHLKKLLED